LVQGGELVEVARAARVCIDSNGTRRAAQIARSARRFATSALLRGDDYDEVLLDLVTGSRFEHSNARTFERMLRLQLRDECAS
jgi:hypothetical protein